MSASVERVESLAQAPRPAAYAGIEINSKNQSRVGVYRPGNSESYQGNGFGGVDNIAALIRRLSGSSRVVAAGITGPSTMSTREFGSQLWLEHDIVPILSSSSSLDTLAREVAGGFSPEGLAKIQFGPNNEVIPSELVAVSEYRRRDPSVMQTVDWLAGQLQGKKIVHVSSTPQGGGVALMRHAEIRLARQLGIDMHWHVLEPDDPRVFDVTKQKMHNTFQGVKHEDLTAEDLEIYNGWIARNAELLRPAYEKADVVVIDDYQPSGLIPYIKQVNPGVRIIYRSHIQIDSSLTDDPTTPQHRTWNALWDGDGSPTSGIKVADAFVSHPMPEFVPGNVPMERVVSMGATTDPFDGLNKPLTPEQMTYYLGEFDRLLVEQGQSPIDHTRPYAVQIARFDPSKGIPHLVESFHQAWSRMKAEGKTIPQLVVTGHSAIDDPDGGRIHAELLQQLQSFGDKEFVRDVHVLRAPHSDQLLNAILRGSRFATQLSTKEGFEVKVTEALMKGIPIIASDQGGIPLQIQEGAGFIVSPGEHGQIAEHMYQLLTNDALRERMSERAIETANPDCTTAQNLANWLYLSDLVLREGSIGDGYFSSVPDRVKAAYTQECEQEYHRRQIRVWGAA